MKWDKLLKLIVIIAVVAVVAILAVKPVIPDVKWLPFTKLIKQGLDIQGGVHVVLEAQDTPDSPVTPDSVKRAMAVIENRVNAFGVAEPIIQQQGDRRIIVELAGIKDPDEAVRNMIKTAYLEFKTEDGTTVLTGRQLKTATEGKNPQSGVAEVNLEFEPDGAKIFADVTAANVGKPIYILLDNQVLQAPNVKEPIPNGKAQISPYESLEAAHNVAILLRSGALPVKLDVMEKRTVGPTLGADSLDKSIKAGIAGLIAILVFMVLYYRLPGLVADFALITYALIVLLIFAALHVTMTLPGIAGFLLSLGMAVDANVIIFERFREEMWAGKTLRSAIDAGFKRAFVAIFDSNVTTLIAAAVLYYFGTGPIKGFAVTLSIGILASMFTAITMTRYLLHLVAGSNLVRNAKMYGA
ncbi:protein translocase subunit SecD [Pelotomaculum isophthalicicum JI]|uniref:Protein translocase subunit SecD n=1 Tax=Pelotomaculum isophthalicicum JI TaxID=947010 RepID=A0A9X4JW89_9FIRM|nr:protein translocase subunit SecD [Pelotomaculum isophthalicicum]MDF9408683.1 protein translocase subunit SecD [Pelotomaculum isophthalicicum JI]